MEFVVFQSSSSSGSGEDPPYSNSPSTNLRNLILNRMKELEDSRVNINDADAGGLADEPAAVLELETEEVVADDEYPADLVDSSDNMAGNSRKQLKRTNRLDVSIKKVPDSSDNAISDADSEPSGEDVAVADRSMGQVNKKRVGHNKFSRKQVQENSSGIGSITSKDEDIIGMTRRCACNLSQCASTNYMCKSEHKSHLNPDGTTTKIEAGCFVEELDPFTLELLSQSQKDGGSVGLMEANGKVTSARRGCIEMLAPEKVKLCSDQTGAPVHCCFDEDMCNYPKTFYPPQIRTPFTYNNRLSFDSNGAVASNMDHQVWLRAALLTIPVFGIIILIILIVFARRMLKNDSKENRIARMNRRSNSNYSSSRSSSFLQHQTAKLCTNYSQSQIVATNNCPNSNNNSSC